MDENLKQRIAAIAEVGAQAMQRAQDQFENCQQKENDGIEMLLSLATEIKTHRGETLTGHKFSFDGPAATPTYQPITGKFTARLFEARFDGYPLGPNSFSLEVEVDAPGQVMVLYRGGADLQSADPKKTIVDAFVSWLRIMRMRYPAPVKPAHRRRPPGLIDWQKVD